MINYIDTDSSYIKRGDFVSIYPHIVNQIYEQIRMNELDKDANIFEFSEECLFCKSNVIEPNDHFVCCNNLHYYHLSCITKWTDYHSGYVDNNPSMELVSSFCLPCLICSESADFNITLNSIMNTYECITGRLFRDLIEESYYNFLKNI